MAEDDVLYGKSGAVASITLNRPEKYNTIRVEMALAIDEMLSAANRDNDVRVIVLEGAGDSFCAGFDFSNGLEHHQVSKRTATIPAWMSTHPPIRISAGFRSTWGCGAA